MGTRFVALVSCGSLGSLCTMDFGSVGMKLERGVVSFGVDPWLGFLALSFLGFRLAVVAFGFRGRSGGPPFHEIYLGNGTGPLLFLLFPFPL